MERNSNEEELIEKNRRIIGISNTYMKDREWLEHAETDIKELLTGIKEIVIIPYALADMDRYTEKLASAFARMGISKATSPHLYVGDEAKVIEDAEAIYIGGGNTGRLVANLHSLTNADGSKVDKRSAACHSPLISAIRRKISQGMPLLGASAGLNVMARDIRTTNDMHIAIQKLTDGSLISRLDAIGVLPPNISLNPHYIEKIIISEEDRLKAIEINSDLGKMLDHQGESRETRLAEALEMDPDRIIIALREGTYLVIAGKAMKVKGETGGFVFRHNQKPLAIEAGDDLSHLLKIKK